MQSAYYVAWWNLENLFDEENSPRRSEKLQRAIGGDLAGWTPARRDRKIAQLASVIAQMNGGAGPPHLMEADRKPHRAHRSGSFSTYEPGQSCSGV
jgi:hypothetical protein